MFQKRNTLYSHSIRHFLKKHIMGASKNKLVLVMAPILALVLALGIYFGFGFGNPQSRQFSGIVLRVEGNSVFLNGVFVVNGKRFGGLKEAEVMVLPETKLTATILYAPSNPKPGVPWDMAGLKKETKEGSLTDLQKEGGLVMLVETGNNVFGKTKFEATKISYEMIKSPESTSTVKGVCEDANGKFIGIEACKAKAAKPQ